MNPSFLFYYFCYYNRNFGWNNNCNHYDKKEKVQYKCLIYSYP